MRGGNGTSIKEVQRQPKARGLRGAGQRACDARRRGDHVKLIQEALNEIDNAGLTADSIYGNATASAVLRFKQKRNIVNRSYQQSADDVVGKMTIAALDDELARRDAQTEVACTLIQPEGPGTVDFARVERPFAITGSTNTPGDAEDRMMQSARARSILSINEALRIMRGLQQSIVSSRLPFGKPLTDDEKFNLAIMGKWMNFNPGAPIRALPTIASVVSLCEKNLQVKNSKGVPPSIQRRAGLGAFGEVQGSAIAHIDHGVDCGDAFFNSGPNCHRDVLTHEFFHFLGVGHGGGGPQDATPRDKITTTTQALNSADNLAQMIGEMTTSTRKTDACARRNE